MENETNQSQNNVVDIKIEDSIKGSYLDYSMSVIIGRALPDARDGLKPVHRRIIYAMHDLKMSSSAPYKKSARIVGDVIGKYHPHGDTSVYDALVRMAQEFSMRVPLIDGQGNFGSVDGDNAAAMRYTESRMTKATEDVLKDIDKDTVNFTATYDDMGKEPAVMPTRIPSLLINGSEGIAVGMATKIPPHNPIEVMDALIHLIDNPNSDAVDLMEFIKGPDFPTGAIIYGKQGFADAYKTGRGKVKMRARHHKELTRTGKEVIVLDELPYQVNKAKLIEQISTLAKEKDKSKLIEGISAVQDDSDRETPIRVTIELKKGACYDIVLNNLFKATPMQTTFGIILLAVHNKEPKIFNLPQILNIFLTHRKTVIIRRTIFDLEKAKARAHILEGLKIALDNIDEVIKIIKSSTNDADASQKLCDAFDLSQIQAKAILDMRLGRLTGLSREKLEEELRMLHALIEELESILKSEAKLNSIIKEELIETRTKYTEIKHEKYTDYKTSKYEWIQKLAFIGNRRTSIEDSFDDIDMEDLIPNEPMVVTITHNGYVKRVPIKAYERQARGGKGKVAVTTHDDDFIEKFFISNTHDTLLFVTNFGQLYWLKVYRLPDVGRTAKGKAVVNLINLKADEKIMAIIPTTDFDESKSMAFFTKNGIVKRTSLSEFSNIRSNGVRAIVLDTDEEGNVVDEIVTASITTSETKYLMIFTALGQVIRFEMDKTRTQGRSTRGVRGIKFKDPNDYVVDADVIDNEQQELLTVSEKGVGKRTLVEAYRLTNRAGSGVISMKLSPKTGKKVVGNVIVEEDQDLMALTSIGKMIRVDMGTIRKAGRNTSGVTIVNVNKGDTVVSIAKCPKEKTEDDQIQLVDNQTVEKQEIKNDDINIILDDDPKLIDIDDKEEN
jgi:DNA gyrase subunit A